MGRQRARMPLFTIGDFVFAKVRGYRAWPARILDRVGSRCYNVYFYGTCNHAKVPRDQICDFEKNQRRLGVIRSKGHVCSPDFKGAMLHARQAFANPETDYGYYQQVAINKGQCVNVEDLSMDYPVADDGGNRQEMQEKDAQEEEWMNQLVEENDSTEQVAQDPLEDLNSGELESKNEPEKQLVEQNLEGQESENQPKEQDSEQQYAMAQLSALKSNKLDSMVKRNRRLKRKTPKDQELVSKKRVSNCLDSKDQPEKQDGDGKTSSDPLVTPDFLMPQLEDGLYSKEVKVSKELDSKDQPEKQHVEVKTSKDPLVTPDFPMPQLDGLNSAELEDLREQERISKDRLDKDVQELMHMLEDLEEYSRSKEDQNPESERVEDMYFVDQPLNLSCCRRRC
ncbi:DNA ligase 1 [Drosophila takahashii]|uniref:DNA ligase 1 n=1 Tax=Drosophila takahashii TaxID=29030 RepID=UPI001CF8F01F|nr:hepatoma-derived growth factor-related protein 2 [Drosophila takahashii]